MIAMLISGGLAGMMAINNVMGEAERLLGNSASGRGLHRHRGGADGAEPPGRRRPCSAVCSGSSSRAGPSLGLWTKIPIELRTVVQGLVILFTGALDMMVRMLLTRIFALFRGRKLEAV